MNSTSHHASRRVCSNIKGDAHHSSLFQNTINMAATGVDKDVFALPATQHGLVDDDRKSDAYESEDLRVDKPHARQKWYQWYSPDDSPAERRLILKLDGLIMIFVFLAYWAKTLDSSATSTAYVSGMKEDLGLYGNQLNYLNTVYT
jgi:hypothetical protein